MAPSRSAAPWASPANTRSDVFFNFLVANPDGQQHLPGFRQLDGNGVPADFFNDIHVRKLSTTASTMKRTSTNLSVGEAVQSKSLAVPGMPGYNEG